MSYLPDGVPVEADALSRAARSMLEWPKYKGMQDSLPVLTEDPRPRLRSDKDAQFNWHDNETGICISLCFSHDSEQPFTVICGVVRNEP